MFICVSLQGMVGGFGNKISFSVSSQWCLKGALVSIPILLEQLKVCLPRQSFFRVSEVCRCFANGQTSLLKSASIFVPSANKPLNISRTQHFQVLSLVLTGCDSHICSWYELVHCKQRSEQEPPDVIHTKCVLVEHSPSQLLCLIAQIFWNGCLCAFRSTVLPSPIIYFLRPINKCISLTLVIHIWLFVLFIFYVNNKKQIII